MKDPKYQLGEFVRIKDDPNARAYIRRLKADTVMGETKHIPVKEMMQTTFKIINMDCLDEVTYIMKAQVKAFVVEIPEEFVEFCY